MYRIHENPWEKPLWKALGLNKVCTSLITPHRHNGLYIHILRELNPWISPAYFEPLPDTRPYDDPTLTPTVPTDKKNRKENRSTRVCPLKHTQVETHISSTLNASFLNNQTTKVEEK